MQDNEILYLDKEGYEEHLKKLEKYILELENINNEIKLIKNGDFESSELLELANKKKKLQKKILKKRNQKVVLIEKNINEDVLDIGDTIRINTYYDNEPEEEICELVTSESTIDGDIEKTNINGPKGKILYGSKVGDTKYFSINKNKIRVDILEKLNIKKLTK